jgi:hypothetical protein
MTLARYMKNYSLKDVKPSDIVGMPRVMTTKDVPAVYQLFNK